MKRRRKSTQCLNCDAYFDKSENYCPKCGQENTDNCTSVFELIKDFFANYVSFDTRLGRTIIPFLLQPGKLTIDFNQGRRVKYMHPLKFYIALSIVYFFFFSYLAMPEITELLDKYSEQKISLNDAKTVLEAAFLEENDSALIQLFQNDDFFQREDISIQDTEEYLRGLGFGQSKIDIVIDKLDSIHLQTFEMNMPKVNLKEFIPESQDYTQYIPDNVKNMPGMPDMDSLNKAIETQVEASQDSLENSEDILEKQEKAIAFKNDSIQKALQDKKEQQQKNWSFNIGGEEQSGKFNPDHFFALIKQKETDPEQLLDFFDINSRKYVPYHLAEQTLKIGRNDPSIFVSQIINNSATMMIFMIPFFAFFLKLFYIKSKRHYIEHLIFTFHLQAFTYFVFIVSLFFVSVKSPGISIGIILIALSVHFVYSLLGFLKVYQQHWFLTLLKMYILGWMYTITLFFFFLGDLFLSFWLF